LRFIFEREQILFTITVWTLIRDNFELNGKT